MTSGFSRKYLNDFDVFERLLTTERYLKALKYFNYTLVSIKHLSI